jgi:HK97 family phage portal protein
VTVRIPRRVKGQRQERSAENPAVPVSSIADDTDLWNSLTHGGAVTRDAALGLSAVWRGVNLIAGDVGRHEFRVYRYEGEGRVLDQFHRATRVMRKPNSYMTAYTFRQVLQAHALLSGNGYAYIVRDQLDGAPREMLPLDPGTVWPVRCNGVVWYVAECAEPIPGKRRNKKQMVRIPAPDMLHIKGLGFDGLCGYDVLTVLAETIGGAIASRDYGSNYFKNNASPGVVLEVPTAMSDKAIRNLRETWSDMHQGFGKSHRPAILRDGVKLSAFTAGSARDAQLLENRSFDAREIANVLGVPAHKLGDPSRTAYNSLESENQGYRDDTLGHWFAAWEQECDTKLLTEEEKSLETHACKFDPRPITSVPLSQRGTYYTQALMGGWLNKDEVRGYENLNPIPGGKGQGYTQPVNVAPVAAPAGPEPEPQPTPETPQ